MKKNKLQKNVLSTVLVASMIAGNISMIPLNAKAEGKADKTIQQQFYVATNGNDETGNGTEANPFATIDRARQEVREVNANMTGDIEVLVKAGRYYVDEAIRFDEKDSGTNEHNVIYKSVDGIGKAEIVGGNPIEGWTAATDEDVSKGLDPSLVGKVYKAELGEKKFDFNALYVEGVNSGYGNDKAIMARYPNYEYDADFPTQKGPYMRASGGTVSSLNWASGTLPDNIIEGMSSAKARGEHEIAQLYVWDGGDWDWFNSTLPIHEIDVAARKIWSVSPEPDNLDVYPIRTKYSIGRTSGARYYLQGNLAFLDVPGEYHYNKSTGTLYYYPAEGVQMDDLTVIAPQTQEIFRFEGSDKPEIDDKGNVPNPEKQASNIILDGFSMKDTEFTEYFSSAWNSFNPTNGLGRYSPEAKGKGVTQPSYDESADRPEFKVGAVTMINTNHITVQNCAIHNTGLWGIALWKDNEYNTIQNCDIGYTGFGAITSDGGYPGVGKYNGYHKMENLRLHHSGQNVGHSGTLSLMSTGHSTFRHLDIQYTPRRAISMIGMVKRRPEDSNYDPYTDCYSIGNLFEYINVYGAEQDAGEDSAVFFAMMMREEYLTKYPANAETPEGYKYFDIGEEKYNRVNQLVIDHVGAAPTMHDKNTNHGMEFAMGAHCTSVSNVKSVNAQSNTTAFYYKDYGNKRDGVWFLDNVNQNYYNEDILNGFDESRMEYDKIGTTDAFPFDAEWETETEAVPEDLYFGDDFESGKINPRKWTIESGRPNVDVANAAEGPYQKHYSLELAEGSASAPAVLSRKFDNALNKIVEVKYFDKRQDYATSDKYGGKPNTSVRADDGKTVVALGVNGGLSRDYYFYTYGTETKLTSVPREFGWHTFRFDYSSGTDVKLSIDDTEVAVLPAENFDYVAMSNWFTNERQACYDQFWIYGGQDAPEAGDIPMPKPPLETDAKEVLYEEDFEDAASDFVGLKADSVITYPEEEGNHYMSGSSSTLYLNLEEAMKWSNYTYECRVRFGDWQNNENWRNASILWNATLDEKGTNLYRYALKLMRGTGGKVNNGFALYKRSHEKPIDNDMIFNRESELDKNFQNQWHDFKVTTTNGHIQAWIDGELIFDHKDSEHKSGTIGIASNASDFDVDDIRVTRQKTDVPTSDYESGNYAGKIDVTLTASDASAKIFYTLDGTDPKKNGLYYYGDEPLSIDKSCTLKAVAISEGMCYSDVAEWTYEIEEVEEKEFAITVNGETTRHDYNEVMEITAPAAPAGQKFAGWEVNGEIVSYKETYRFYVSGDMELTATYADEVTEVAKAMLTNVIKTPGAKENTSNVKFVGELSLPEGYEIVNAGLIWSSKEDTTLILDAGTDNAKLNIPALKPTYISRISDTNQFSVTIKGMPDGRFIRGAVFAEVKNTATGEIKLIHSQEVNSDTAQ